MGLPKGFVLGVGTSAFQTEGAVAEGGRGPSIWDQFVHTPGRVHRGDTADITCDSYHRMEADLDIIADLGVDAYRFSVSWPRVLPEGRGNANPRGLEYYKHLIYGLRQRAIMPVVTLYHWDLPLALEAAGGWPERKTVGYFVDYVRTVVEALGDGVGMWITINQPQSCAMDGYGTGIRAPGLTDLHLAASAAHNLMIGHALAVSEIHRSLGGAARVGISLNLRPVRPLLPADGPLARQVACDRYETFLLASIMGAYPQRSWLTKMLEESSVRELETADRGLDFVGINYYGPLFVTRQPDAVAHCASKRLGEYGRAVQVVPAGMECSAMGTVIDSGGLTEVIAQVRSYGAGLQLFVTECGYATPDYVDPEGRVRDDDRCDYLSRHLRAAASCDVPGGPAGGFFVWSLFDNFEWTEGYSQRFGVVYVDFETQRRVPKQSARWLARVARTRWVGNE